MGRKVGKKRSKALNDSLNALHTDWDVDYRILGLTKNQWRNFNNFANDRLLKEAIAAGVAVVSRETLNKIEHERFKARKKTTPQGNERE